jgi:hypothetical protein
LLVDGRARGEGRRMSKGHSLIPPSPAKKVFGRCLGLFSSLGEIQNKSTWTFTGQPWDPGAYFRDKLRMLFEC